MSSHQHHTVVPLSYCGATGFAYRKPQQPQSEAEALVAHAHTGTPYEIDEAQLAVLQDSRISPRDPGWRPLPPRISLEEALDLLNHRGDVTPAIRAAADRLKYAMRLPHASYDVIIKVFNDLDTFLFHGQLRRRVCLRWAYLTRDSPSKSEPGAVTLGQTFSAPYHGLDRILIIMNLEIPWPSIAREEMFGTLAHEMIHAWFDLFCGVQRDVMTKWYMNEAHGHFFHRARKRIEQISGLKLFHKSGRVRAVH